MPINIGDSGQQPSRIYVGSTRVNRVFRGTTRLWPPGAVMIGWDVNRTMYRFEPATSTFTQVGTPGTYGRAFTTTFLRDSGPVVNVDGTWYGFGVRRADGDGTTGRIYTVNPSTGVWTVLRVMTPTTTFTPFNAQYIGAGYDGTNVYLFQSSRTVWRVNIATGALTNLGRTTISFSGFPTVAWTGSRFVSFGGDYLGQSSSGFTVTGTGSGSSNTATSLGAISTGESTSPPGSRGRLWYWSGYAYDPDADVHYGISEAIESRFSSSDPIRVALRVFTLDFSLLTATRVGTGEVVLTGSEYGSYSGTYAARAWID